MYRPIIRHLEGRIQLLLLLALHYHQISFIRLTKYNSGIKQSKNFICLTRNVAQCVCGLIVTG